jgi:glycosyltransferase involved in cell wall biosynthesis
MSNNFYSIVIPTRNRPDILSSAIKSVLTQELPHFEVIVSDNSTTELSDEVRKVVESFNDARIRYVRPDKEMPMGEHWEFAVSHATGEYIGILTDRMVLKKNALIRLDRVIEEYQPEVVSYIWDVVPNDHPPLQYSQRRFTDRVIKYPSSVLLDASSRSEFPHLLPRGLNTFCRKSFLFELKRQHKNLFLSISPDYYFCYLVLSHLDFIHYYDATLSISWGEHVSNGTNALRGRMVKDVQDFLSFMKKHGGLRYAPIPIKSDKFIPIPFNSLLHEYNLVASLLKNDKFKKVDEQIFYHKALKRIRSMKKRFGTNLNASRNLLEMYRIDHNLESLPYKKENRLIKVVLKKIIIPLLPFFSLISTKLNLDFRYYDFISLPKGRFKYIEEILDYESENPRKASKTYCPPINFP